MVEEDNSMALARAAEKGDVEELKKLIDNGTDVNEKPTKGMSALMVASEKKKADTVKFLLERGAEPNEKDLDDMTALTTSSKTVSFEE